MQVIITSPDGGNVFTLDGLAAVNAVSETVIGGAFSEILVDQGGGSPIFSFMAPVQGAIAEGAPVPTSDEELQALFELLLPSFRQSKLGL